MKISFKIFESIEQIIEQITNDWPTVWKSQSCDDGSFRLVDEKYNSYAICRISAQENEIIIRTAWSKYEYIITPTDNGCNVRYTGSYRGLLEQLLLPTMTPEFNGTELVESSLQTTQLEKYIYLQDDFSQFRKSHKALHTHIHPKCILNYFFKKFQDEFTD